ncbi:prolyl 3-hydroxylase 1 isoform X1 [Nomia melanderi]|uniref:prolyl 3-hydroxylase 1 isoform X1 n=1 Tax=Nomia melanderi TaxID=2448451 RepID=UPI003FCD6D01
MGLLGFSFFLLFALCTFLRDATAGSNDTVINEIPIDEPADATRHAEPETPMTNRTLHEIFRDAVQAYLEEDWDGCIEDFNEVSHGYKMYKRMVTNCRQKCRMRAAGDAPIFPENIEDLHFYEKKLVETLCLLTCNQEYREIAGTLTLKTLPRETEHKLIDYRVYEYLHICYFKKDRYQDAANAVFTFLVRQPDHEASMKSLKYYLTLPGVTEKNVVNLEAWPYVSTYFKAVLAYEDENYAEAASFFESSLASYLQSEEECRFYCEGPFNQGWHPEFTSSIANHFTYCLKCKRSCSHQLNNVNGDYRSDMLKSHYNYLQFSYYKLGNLKAACAAVASYLVFDPVDGTMLQNKKYYSSQPMVEESYFVPREEVLRYVKRQEYELGLLRYISHEFSIIDRKLANWNKSQEKPSDDSKEKESEKSIKEVEAPHPPPGYSSLSNTQLFNNRSAIRDERPVASDRKRQRVRDDVYLIAEQKELGGKNRYVADGFLNSTECESLMRLATMTAVEGDGYNEYKSPHSRHEKFEGITVGRVALMVYFGRVEAERLRQLLAKTEDARGHVERYFGLDRPLYITYTHLVCRTALPDSPMDRDDLSHQVHADNCILTGEDNCIRESPAYVWRDYSAILYLNEDFQGGEFFFAKERAIRDTDSLVSPRCGRMVAFSAGGENLHGVRAVLRGRRCALALWFTQDQMYTEYERTLAEAILERIRSIGPVKEEEVQVPLRYEELLLQYASSDDFLRRFLQDS